MAGRLDKIVTGRVLTLTFNDPDSLNAIDALMVEEARVAFLEAGLDDSIGAIILTGAGGNFSSGGNLKEILKLRARPKEDLQGFLGDFHEMVEAVAHCPKPVIAAVEGAAAGAGFSMALGADLMVASEAARFSMAYVKVGVTPDGGGTAWILRSLPRQLVAELVFEGGELSAQRLQQMGVVNRVVPADQVQDEAMAWATRLADGPTSTLGRAKGLIRDGFGAALSTQLDRESEAFIATIFSETGEEGVQAFLEKRRPNYHKD